jgi:heptose-I-phosphate ethanolaminephosphotransferase
MRRLRTLAQWLLRPVTTNSVFFVTMYALGVLSAILTLPDNRQAELYDNLFLELFLNDYIACIILTFFPSRIRVWVKRLFYVIIYSVTIIDVYCFWKFASTLTPTMLLLVSETDSREAGEFLRSYLSTDILFSPLSWIFLVIICHVLWSVRRFFPRLPIHRWERAVHAWVGPITTKASKPLPQLLGGGVVAVLLTMSLITSWHNIKETARLMTADTIGTVEHILTEKDHAVLYLPMYRLAFSIYSNELAAKQVDRCIAAAQGVKVDSCSFRSPTIVFIIGESYGKEHSQLYGYRLKTTPLQEQRKRSGLLTPFSDVVSCWNLTSFVFKNFLSMHVIGQKGEWCDYPLFPELFRKAGYHVTFLTNQFLSRAKEAVYDFSGGFFLNHPTLSDAMFDTRNNEIHRFDDGLLADYDQFVGDSTIKLKQPNLIIFHLIGQHVNYRTRCPDNQRVFGLSNYKEARPELSDHHRHVIADYDNAVHYNDSIVDAIIKRFENKDAIVVYMPDHGEECYEPGRNFICRNHSAAIDWPLAHYEFEVPFWIYCSHRYAVRHPEVFKAIKDAKDRRFMTDALPHLMLWLAGIGSKDYHAEYNVLSPDYNEMRPRILKNSADYDKLREEALRNPDIMPRPKTPRGQADPSRQAQAGFPISYKH